MHAEMRRRWCNQHFSILFDRFYIIAKVPTFHSFRAQAGIRYLMQPLHNKCKRCLKKVLTILNVHKKARKTVVQSAFFYLIRQSLHRKKGSNILLFLTHRRVQGVSCNCCNTSSFSSKTVLPETELYAKKREKRWCNRQVSILFDRIYSGEMVATFCNFGAQTETTYEVL